MTRSFDPVQLGSIEMFCKAAELQGFTAAAQTLGVTAAAVSRSVGRLEERLGAKLFTRTTRLMRLTEEGRAYFEQCRHALAQSGGRWKRSTLPAPQCSYAAIGGTHRRGSAVSGPQPILRRA